MLNDEFLGQCEEITLSYTFFPSSDWDEDEVVCSDCDLFSARHVHNVYAILPDWSCSYWCHHVRMNFRNNFFRMRMRIILLLTVPFARLLIRTDVNGVVAHRYCRHSYFHLFDFNKVECVVVMVNVKHLSRLPVEQ